MGSRSGCQLGDERGNQYPKPSSRRRALARLCDRPTTRTECRRRCFRPTLTGIVGGLRRLEVRGVRGYFGDRLGCVLTLLPNDRLMVFDQAFWGEFETKGSASGSQ